MLDDNEENLALARRIREAIGALPFTKGQVAERLSVTPQAITGWETKGRIGKKSLAGLSALTGLSVNYFLSGAADKRLRGKASA